MRIKGSGEWFKEGESRGSNPEMGMNPGVGRRAWGWGL